MKPLSILTLTLLTFSLTLMAHAEVWESTAGTQIEAELVRVDGESVVLKKEDGSEITVPLKLLSEDSKALLPKEETEESPEEVAPESDESPATDGAVKTFVRPEAEPNPRLELSVETAVTPVLEIGLSTFKEGRWKGLHAVYENEKFDIEVSGAGRTTIYLKDDEGKRMPEWMALTIYPGVNNDFGGGIGVESISSSEEASIQPDKLEFEGLSKEGDTFEFTLILKENSLSWRGHLEDTGEKEDCVLHLSVLFNKVYGYDSNAANDLEIAETQVVVGDSTVVFSGEGGDDVTYDVADLYIGEDCSGHLRLKHPEAVVNLTAFAPRILTFTSNPDEYDNNHPHLWMPDSWMFAQFAVTNRKIDSYSDDKDEVLTLTID